MSSLSQRYTNPVSKAFSFQKTWLYFDNDVQHVMVTTLNSTGTAPIYVDFLPVSSGNPPPSNALPCVYWIPLLPLSSVHYHHSSALRLHWQLCRQSEHHRNLRSASYDHQTLHRMDPAPANHHDSDTADPAGAVVVEAVFPGRPSSADPFGTGLQSCGDARVYAMQNHVRGRVMAVFWESGMGRVRVPPGRPGGARGRGRWGGYGVGWCADDDIGPARDV